MGVQSLHLFSPVFNFCLANKRFPIVLSHQDVASGPFCLLVNSPWPLVFSMSLFFLLLSGISLYCWKGIYFSWSLDINFFFFSFGLVTGLHFWLRDLLREFYKKYEILLMVLFLVFFLFLISEALLLFHSFGHPSIVCLHLLEGSG